MPELPEVETIRAGLHRALKNLTIARVDVVDDRVLRGFLPSGAPRRDVSPAAFAKAAEGKAINAVLRRGKYIGSQLSDGRCLVWHLRMTGRMIVGAPRADA